MAVTVRQEGQGPGKFSAGVLTSVTTVNAAWEIRSGATVGGSAVFERFRIDMIRLSLTAATASTIGIGRPAALGITPGTLTQLVSHANGGLGGCSVQVATTWGTGPTVPATFLLRGNLPATIGSTIEVDFDELWVPANGSIVIWNTATNSAMNVTAIVSALK